MPDGNRNLLDNVTPSPHRTSGERVTQLRPRPPLPEQHLTRRPLAHDLDAWYAAAESAMGGAA